MSKRIIVVYKVDHKYHFNIESGNHFKVSKPYWLRRNAEKDAKKVARELKAKYVGYEENEIG